MAANGMFPNQKEEHVLLSCIVQCGHRSAMTEREGGGKTSLLLNSDVTVTKMAIEEVVVVLTDLSPPPLFLSTYMLQIGLPGWVDVAMLQS